MFQNLGIRNDLEAIQPLLEWAGSRVADVGCGPGALARSLVKLGAIVHGFEPDPVQAAKNAAEPHDGVLFEQAGAEQLPIDDRVLDAVVLSRSLHHVPKEQMDAALVEARRVLKPGGMLVVIEPDIHGQFSQLIRPFHDETVCRANALAALDRAAPAFTSVRELWFTSVGLYESFGQFRDRMLGMSFNSFAQERIEDPVVHACFAAGEVEGGFRFTNPNRMRIYRA